MGYSTDFDGQLLFVQPLTAEQLLVLQAMLGEDCREHPEWENTEGLYYVDLQLTGAGNGIEWSGDEKTYNMEGLVNLLIRQMRKQWPDFGLSGTLLAQGEAITDRWKLCIDADGWAVKIPMALDGEEITCPHCRRTFLKEHPEGWNDGTKYEN